MRKENKLTQAELAKKLQVTDKAVSKWERELPEDCILPYIAVIVIVTIVYFVRKHKKK